uniref:Putative transcriptional activator protein n=1 Tax=viral metagenome TaxID=1070528 RepID=A0A6M3IDE7_9ZZZZ
MNCPECKTKMKIQESRHLTYDVKYREYICPDCLKVYKSYEELDKDPLDRKGQEVQMKYIKERWKKRNE